MSDPKVGLIMLPYDNPMFFERAVFSVMMNTDYSNFELVISHNPCEDAKKNEKIKDIIDTMIKHFPSIKFVINKENLYHGKGCMEGVKLLDDNVKYVVLLNDDIFIPGNSLNWLEEIVKFAESHVNAATITPSLYHLRETVYWCGRKKDSGSHDFLHFHKGDIRIPKEPFTTSYNNMAICFTKKALLDEFPLGNFCPHYGSDESFCNQIKDKYPEAEHWVIPKIKLYHENIFSLRENHGKDIKVEG